VTDELTRYEYVLVRYVHDLASEEFVNIGIILFSREQGKFFVRMNERIGRVSEFFGDVRTAGLRSQVRQIQRAIVTLDEDLVHASLLEAPPASLQPIVAALVGESAYSCFRASDLRYGVTADPADRCDALFEEFIGRYERSEERLRRDEAQISREIDHRLARVPFKEKIDYAVRLESDTYAHEFHAGWQNGKRQVLEPVSFDYAAQGRIVDKASLWSGRLAELSRVNEFGFTALAAPPSEPTFGRAYERAVSILRRAPSVRAVIEEKDADWVLSEISRDIASQSAE
jgi:hypothetical protein